MVDWKNKEEVREYQRKYMKDWYAANPDKTKEYKRKYRAANKDTLNAKNREYYHRTIEQQHEKCRRYQQEHPEKSRERSKRWNTNNPEKAMFQRAKQRAKLKGIEFTITYKDILIPSHCPIFGIPLYSSDFNCNDNSPSLDRIDNNYGYIPGNIIVISNRANNIKGVGTADEHMRIAEFMKSYNYDL